MRWTDRAQTVKAYTYITFLFFFSSIFRIPTCESAISTDCEVPLRLSSPSLLSEESRKDAGTYLAPGRRTNNLSTPHRNLTPLASPHNNL